MIAIDWEYFVHPKWPQWQTCDSNVLSILQGRPFYLCVGKKVCPSLIQEPIRSVK